jgi:branched-chain amino acid transport system permease protein
MAGFGGTLISMSYNIQPTMGLEYTVIAFIVIVLGGLGSIPGSFIGGLLLGLVGSIVTHFEPGLSLVAYYVIFMLLLLAKPTGILGK